MAVNCALINDYGLFRPQPISDIDPMPYKRDKYGWHYHNARKMGGPADAEHLRDRLMFRYYPEEDTRFNTRIAIRQLVPGTYEAFVL